MMVRRLGWPLVTLAVLGASVAVAAPQVSRAWSEARFYAKPVAAHAFSPLGPEWSGETIIGQPRFHTVAAGDTLLDIARYYSLGLLEVRKANPDLDVWVPAVGARVNLPTEWVLPCCEYEGIVVNIPEMRLYYYHPAAPGGPHLVSTFAVGLGRDDWQTPEGKFRIRGKTINPTWIIPESIRREHLAERGDARRSIPGGDPDNPLGHYRLELTLPGYAIHGTNIPWGVGTQVSHGCIRLYPEDIAWLFPQVPVGAPGRFLYQPVKVGIRGGDVYVEVHDDIYGRVADPWGEVMRTIHRMGWSERVDREKLRAALQAKDGLPVNVTLDPFAVEAVETER